jgi:hypothetical protein
MFTSTDRERIRSRVIEIARPRNAAVSMNDEQLGPELRELRAWASIAV